METGNIVRNSEFENLNKEIKIAIKISAKDMVRLGYMLRRMMEQKLYLVYYSCFDEYLSEELHMDYTAATRFIKCNKKYSRAGNSLDLAPEYAEYSRSLLVEMLNMPPELEAKISPDMTVKQVREIKRQEKQKKEAVRPDPEEKEPPESEPETPVTDSLQTVKDILRKEQKLLHDYIEVGEIPEFTLERQKIIVAALAAMICDLENNPVPDPQPELPVLKNNDQRKEWLADYKEWGLWYRDGNLDVNYYKYDFPDGSRLVVAEYPQRQSYYASEYRDEYHYHLLEKNKKGYIKSYDEKFRQQTDSETYLVEFLKDIQKSRKRQIKRAAT